MRTSLDHLSRSAFARALAVASILAILPGTGHGQIVRRRPRAILPPPSQPQPLPPQPSFIRNDLMYKASRFSLETYPMFSWVQTNHYIADNAPAAFGTMGFGTRLDWRVKPALSLTGDLTASVFGGPYVIETFELGSRYHPFSTAHRARPYFDFRGSWTRTMDVYAQQSPGGGIVGSPFGFLGSRVTTDGFGGLAGVGLDYYLTRGFALTTNVGVSRHLMGNVSVDGSHMGPAYDYRQTTTRFAIGMKYTPQHLIVQDPTMIKH